MDKKELKSAADALAEIIYDWDYSNEERKLILKKVLKEYLK